MILASTVYEVIREWKRLVPEGQTLHWMGGTEAELQKRLAALRAADFKDITQLQVHVRLNTNSANAEPFTLPRSFLRAVGEELRRHDILYQSLPWDVAEPKVHRELLRVCASLRRARLGADVAHASQAYRTHPRRLDGLRV